MLGKLALKYYNEGFNCSQCIIKACDKFYGLGLENTTYDMLRCVSDGFGICSLCSVFAAGVMVIGLMFDERKAKGLRIAFLTEAAKAFGGTDCPKVRSYMHGRGGCARVIEAVGNMLEKIISSS